MSGPVNVLAELDALIIIRAARAVKAGAPLSAVGDLQRAESTRAAVAELIEVAARAVLLLKDDANRYEDDGSNEPLECLRDLQTALARVGGAA